MKKYRFFCDFEIEFKILKAGILEFSIPFDMQLCLGQSPCLGVTHLYICKTMQPKKQFQ